MDINEFRTEKLEEIHLNASMNGTTPREEFLALYSSALIDAEELEDFEQLAFEGVGLRGRRIQLDGYYYSELEDCLSFAVCAFQDSVEIQSITATDAEVWFRRVQAFVEEARSGFIQKNAEESSPGYGLAIDVQMRYRNVSRFKFYVLTDMLMSSRIKEISGNEIDGIPTEYHIWDIARWQALEESKSGKEDITINLKDFTAEGIPCLQAGSTEDYTAYLCNIPGKILADLYNKYGGRLLEGNVRSFLSARGKINKGIRNTILNKPTMFFAYNNGIAATAYNAKLDETGRNITEITALQIVNGGQTTASLATALLEDKDRANDLTDIYVPMKLSIVSPEKAVELIPDIAKYANKQNRVSDADFFSNHPFHVRMEGFSRRVLAPAAMGKQYGTHWYYERARGQYRQEQAHMKKSEKEKFLAQNPKNQMFTKTDLAKVYNIYRKIPNQVAAGAQKNFMEFAAWASKEWEKNETVFNEEFFKKVVVLEILYKKTDALVKNAPWYELGYKAQVVTYALSLLFYLIQKECPDKALNFKSIWSRQDISPATQKQIDIIAEEVYYYLTSPKRGVQNVTEWAKRKDCWTGAMELAIHLIPEFKDELTYLYAQKEEETNARQNQRQENKVNQMIVVANYGIDKWKEALAWGKEKKLLTPMEISLLNSAIAMERGTFPSERQCNRILQVLEKLREESFPG